MRNHECIIPKITIHSQEQENESNLLYALDIRTWIDVYHNDNQTNQEPFKMSKKPFNLHYFKSGMMKRQTLLIISIIATGSLFGAVYASGTIITDTGITTGNLTVTGTCTGCGAGEGSYSNYNTIQLNTTIGTAFIATQYTSMSISNNGNVVFGSNGNNTAVTIGGTIIQSGSGYASAPGVDIAQSITGEYQLIVVDDVHYDLKVIKNGIFLQDIGIDLSQFISPDAAKGVAMAISPDGHYISVIGKDSGGTSERLVIFKGS
jgi:hypothetical protein